MILVPLTFYSCLIFQQPVNSRNVPAWMQGQYIDNPVSFKRIKNELPEFPSDWDLSFSSPSRKKYTPIVVEAFEKYRKDKSIDNLYRALLLVPYDPYSSDTYLTTGYQIDQELFKLNSASAEFARATFVALVLLESNVGLPDEFRDNIFRTYLYDEQVQLAYALFSCRMSSKKDDLHINRSLSLLSSLDNRYPNSDYFSEKKIGCIFYSYTKPASKVQQSVTSLEKLLSEKKWRRDTQYHQNTINSCISILKKRVKYLKEHHDGDIK